MNSTKMLTFKVLGSDHMCTYNLDIGNMGVQDAIMNQTNNGLKENNLVSKWNPNWTIPGSADARPSIMTSSNGNIFRVTGPLCGEFTGHRHVIVKIFLSKLRDGKIKTNLWR